MLTQRSQCYISARAGGFNLEIAPMPSIQPPPPTNDTPVLWAGRCRLILRKSLLLLCLAFLSAPLIVSAQNVIDEVEFRFVHSVQSDAALLIAPIRSLADLDAHLATKDAASSPLNYLRADKRQAFLDSLVFAPAGLASFDHTVFRRLTPTQSYQVLALFGLQWALPGMDLGASETEFDEALLASGDFNLSFFCQVPRPASHSGIADPKPSPTGCPGNDWDLQQDSMCKFMGGGSRRCVSPNKGSSCRISTCR